MLMPVRCFILPHCFRLACGGRVAVHLTAVNLVLCLAADTSLWRGRFEIYAQHCNKNINYNSCLVPPPLLCIPLG